MARAFVHGEPRPLATFNHAVTLTLLGTNFLFNLLANTGFKFAAMSTTWRSFLAWQVVGNLAGFISVLTLTGLLRYLPLHVVYPVTAGLTALGVQVILARMVFGETISSTRWFGSLLVAVGIVLIGGG
ncbi:MAG: hypothetical protein GX493_06665 [Firmicutes bacterium]|nr:hypothetical protein [Bacillota bacterium]